MKHMGAEASSGTFLHREQHFVVLRQAPHKHRVKRLGEAGIGDGCRYTIGRQTVCGP